MLVSPTSAVAFRLRCVQAANPLRRRAHDHLLQVYRVRHAMEGRLAHRGARVVSFRGAHQPSVLRAASDRRDCTRRMIRSMRTVRRPEGTNDAPHAERVFDARSDSRFMVFATRRCPRGLSRLKVSRSQNNTYNVKGTSWVAYVMCPGGWRATLLFVRALS